MSTINDNSLSFLHDSVYVEAALDEYTRYGEPPDLGVLVPTTNPSKVGTSCFSCRKGPSVGELKSYSYTTANPPADRLLKYETGHASCTNRWNETVNCMSAAAESALRRPERYRNDPRTLSTPCSFRFSALARPVAHQSRIIQGVNQSAACQTCHDTMKSYMTSREISCANASIVDADSVLLPDLECRPRIARDSLVSRSRADHIHSESHRSFCPETCAFRRISQASQNPQLAVEQGHSTVHTHNTCVSNFFSTAYQM